ncbi:MAG: hypothetical protein IPK26_14905 [Planctomycetes bacterium]|nr:hypothetical protein [Planctomycetota bacterium]
MHGKHRHHGVAALQQWQHDAVLFVDREVAGRGVDGLQAIVADVGTIAGAVGDAPAPVVRVGDRLDEQFHRCQFAHAGGRCCGQGAALGA